MPTQLVFKKPQEVEEGYRLVEAEAIYTLYLKNGGEIMLNDSIGKNITLSFLDEKNCLQCNRKTNKTFNQGYCFVCLQTLAQNDLCIKKPELCHYHQNTCRQPDWAQKHCFIPHSLYLAFSPTLKVGISRSHQVETRWTDQGAIFALELLGVSSRFEVGLLEKYLVDCGFNDKTAWQKMLQSDSATFDKPTLLKQIKKAQAEVLDYLHQKQVLSPVEKKAISFQTADKPILQIKSPGIVATKPIKSLSFDKLNQISGKLLGVRGQYLILDSGVLNIRKFGGYKVAIEWI